MRFPQKPELTGTFDALIVRLNAAKPAEGVNADIEAKINQKQAAAGGAKPELKSNNRITNLISAAWLLRWLSQTGSQEPA
jgi:hypothetical protein